MGYENAPLGFSFRPQSTRNINILFAQFSFYRVNFLIITELEIEFQF